MSAGCMGAHLVVNAQGHNVHGALHLPHGGPEVPAMGLHRHPQPGLDLQAHTIPHSLLPGDPEGPVACTCPMEDEVCPGLRHSPRPIHELRQLWLFTTISKYFMH